MHNFFFLINNFSIENRTKQIHLKITQEEDLNKVIKSHLIVISVCWNYMKKFDLFYNHFERIIINNNRRKVRLTNYPVCQVILIVNLTILSFNISNLSNSIYQ